MNALVLYQSEFGNTERIAHAIAGVLARRGSVRVLAIGELGDLDPGAFDFLAVGAPTQIHRLPDPVKHRLTSLPRGTFRDLPALAFDTRIEMPSWLSGSAATQIGRRLRRLGCRLLAPPESFFVTDREGPLAVGELERARAWATDALVGLPAPAARVAGVAH